MPKVHTYNETARQRIRDAVNRVEAMPIGTGRRDSTRKLVPWDSAVTVRITGAETGGGKYGGVILEPTTADVSAGTDLDAADAGSTTSAIACLTLNLAEEGATTHALLDCNVIDYVGRIAYINEDGTPVVHINGDGCSGTGSTTLSGTGATANTSSWILSATSSRVTVAIETRNFWDTTSDILYGFSQSFTYECGMLVSISAETRYTVDTPDGC